MFILRVSQTRSQNPDLIKQAGSLASQAEKKNQVDRAMCATECAREPHSSLGISCVDASTESWATRQFFLAFSMVGF